jgi:hypothetical protein
MIENGPTGKINGFSLTPVSGSCMFPESEKIPEKSNTKIRLGSSVQNGLLRGPIQAPGACSIRKSRRIVLRCLIRDVRSVCSVK